MLRIDTSLGMGRASLNATGNLAVTSIVAKTEKMLDLDFWSGRPKAKV